MTSWSDSYLCEPVFSASNAWQAQESLYFVSVCSLWRNHVLLFLRHLLWQHRLQCLLWQLDQMRGCTIYLGFQQQMGWGNSTASTADVVCFLLLLISLCLKSLFSYVLDRCMSAIFSMELTYWDLVWAVCIQCQQASGFVSIPEIPLPLPPCDLACRMKVSSMVLSTSALLPAINDPAMLIAPCFSSKAAPGW